MQRLGAVTASALESGDSVTAAFDGELLNRPSDPTRGARRQGGAARPVLRRLRAQPPLPLLTGDPARAFEPLAYKLVRPSTVTAQLIGPDGVPRVLESRRRARARLVLRSRSRRTTPRERGTGASRRPTTSAASRRSSARSATTRRSRGSPRRVVATGSATIRFTLARSAAGAAAHRDEGRRRRPRAAHRESAAGAAAARLGRTPAARDARVRRHLRRASVRHERRSARPTSPFRSASDALVRVPPVTSWLAHYGVFAVFVLMLIDAVFPAASELVMVYGGALASGALTHERRRARLARDRARRVPRRRRSPACSATSSARSAAGGSATAAAGRSSSGTGAGST